VFEYIIKRILLAILTLFVILTISYILLRVAPGDPSRSSFLGENAAGSGGVSAEKGELSKNISIEEELHLNKPVYIGFYLWLKEFISHGNFGRSIIVDKGKPVFTVIFDRLPVTLTINFWAILVIYLISIPLGIFSAVTKRKNLDKFVTFLLFFLYSLPAFWVALLLQVILCKGGIFSIFPLKGISNINIIGLTTWKIAFISASHYILPVICLSYAGFAGISRYCRENMKDVMKKDYIRTTRAKGLPEGTVIYKHALKNAVITLITLFADLVPGLIAGSIIVEYIFNIPGMGDLSMLALSSRDIPLLMALFFLNGALVLTGILVADILYVLADPRINFLSKT